MVLFKVKIIFSKIYERGKGSAKDPFNFDADPDLDPGSALEKNGSESWSRLFP